MSGLVLLLLLIGGIGGVAIRGQLLANSAIEIIDKEYDERNLTHMSIGPVGRHDEDVNGVQVASSIRPKWPCYKMVWKIQFSPLGIFQSLLHLTVPLLSPT
jgi:hypothetical protein